jgi:hypothetical protein
VLAPNESTWTRLASAFDYELALVPSSRSKERVPG